MTGGRPVREGAASVLWGIDLPDDGPTGGFFRDGVPLAWSTVLATTVLTFESGRRLTLVA